MSIIHAVLLGIIQGLTEFLPVSSSGHLVLFQKLFGISEPALLFDTMLHVGTLAAVVAVLWKDIWAILRKLNQPLTLYLIFATVPTVIAALVFRKPLERAFETGHFLGFAFLMTSALLAAAELLAKRGATKGGTAKNATTMNWLDALIVGVMQAIAIIPGVSRSGATLSGALSRRLDRDFAARFSFLLSIPAILGAVVFQLKDLVKGEAVDNGRRNCVRRHWSGGYDRGNHERRRCRVFRRTAYAENRQGKIAVGFCHLHRRSWAACAAGSVCAKAGVLSGESAARSLPIKRKYRRRPAMPSADTNIDSLFSSFHHNNICLCANGRRTIVYRLFFHL